MDRSVKLAQKAGWPFLRISLGVVLFWIGALKFADPSPVVGLLEASLAFLASNGFVYVLGVVEILSAVALFANVGVRYVAPVLMLLFAGTLLILVITPAVAYGEGGFPHLSLAGEFLLKDLVLFGAALVLIGSETSREPDRERTESRLAPEDEDLRCG